MYNLGKFVRYLWLRSGQAFCWGYALLVYSDGRQDVAASIFAAAFVVAALVLRHQRILAGK